ncbi:MAG: hypothetical protein LKE89_08735 [Lactobacillaceae bacterium]|jgi:hypothetical glycosyl hydrolase|nr:hypothetical protein [Lactobacillaceae bacterium]
MEKINHLLAYSLGHDPKLYERFFDVRHQQKFESIFCMGNGYLGLRACHEEQYAGQSRGMYLQGTFQTASQTTRPELPNLPDVIGTELVLDKCRLDLTQGKLLNYERYLNLHNGQTVRRFDCQFGERHYHLVFRRFASFAEKHLIATQIEIIPSQASQVELTTAINGEVSNHGTQYFIDGQQRYERDNGLSYQFEGLDHNLRAAIYQLTSANEAADKTSAKVERRRVSQTMTFSLTKDQPLIIEVFSAVTTSRDRDSVYHDAHSLWQRAAKICQAAQTLGYAKNQTLNSQAWATEVWRTMPITIDSRTQLDQLMLDFARYHLHAMTATDNDLVNIAAKGLSGEGYKGHNFWDTDIFMLPYFQFEYPKIARNLVNYRYQQLPACREHAVTTGYQGAQYPWESAEISQGDNTPKWASFNVDTGKPSRIWTGELEVHISADVTYGLMRYCASLPATDDYLLERGLAVLFDTARFWTSRVAYVAKHQRYEILDVIGPDEYKEHVNNSTYTNYLAYYNMFTALQWLTKLEAKPAQYQRYSQQYDLPDLKAALQRITANFYLPRPNDDGIIPENDTFLTLPEIDLRQLSRSSEGNLLKNLSIDTVNAYQIAKQADVVLVLLAFPEQFSEHVITENLAYYEARTMNDSSLSYGSYAIANARHGQLVQAHDLFHQSGFVDLNSDPTASVDGIHAAAMGQIWNTAIQGFAGLRIVGNQLSVTPHLPE